MLLRKVRKSSRAGKRQVRGSHLELSKPYYNVGHTVIRKETFLAFFASYLIIWVPGLFFHVWYTENRNPRQDVTVFPSTIQLLCNKMLKRIRKCTRNMCCWCIISLFKTHTHSEHRPHGTIINKQWKGEWMAEESTTAYS